MKLTRIEMKKVLEERGIKEGSNHSLKSYLDIIKEFKLETYVKTSSGFYACVSDNWMLSIRSLNFMVVQIDFVLTAESIIHVTLKD